MVVAMTALLMGLGGPMDLRTMDLSPLRLRPEGELAQSPLALDVSLRSPLLGLDGRFNRTRWLAQNTPRTDAAPATPPADAQPASDQCAVDCAELNDLRDAERTARYTLRRRRANLSVHRAFGIATWGSMLVTEALGTIMTMNNDTWFGRGYCAGSGCIGGDSAGTISTVHQFFAFTTTALYVTTGVIGVTAPDPDRESEGDSDHARTLRLHKLLAWVHAGGMVLMPILGILAVNADLFTDNGETRQSISRAMRSVHTIVGYTTLASLTFAGILEF